MSHALHLFGEAALGVIGLSALTGCLLVWRLAQGPIDVTPLIQREHALLNAKGSHVTIGQAALAWEGFAATGQPLDVAVQDVIATLDGGRSRVGLKRARVALSIPDLLLGRIAPAGVWVDGADVLIDVGGADKPGGAVPADVPPWLRRLRRVRLHHAALTMRGVLPSADVRAPSAELDITRLPGGGIAGSASLDVRIGDVAGAVDVQAAVRDGVTQLTATAGPVSPAALAELSPALDGLRGLDAPVRLAGQARLGPGFQLAGGHVQVTADAGVLHAGFGGVALSSIEASLSLGASEARLESLRVKLAPLSGPGVSGAPPPVITGSGTVTRQGGRVHATFGVQIDAAEMADLPWYWPEGTGGGARDWLTQNVPAGRAHDAHVSGSLDGQAGLTDLQLTSLSGGLLADDVTVHWLRPVPPLEHGLARVVIEGPDALRVTMEKGGQNGLSLAPGAAIRITGLSTKHQFGDIDLGMSGALPDALGLLNHPRLGLLSRSGMDIVGAAGDVSARLTLHVPLEDNVTMDDIPIAARATLHRVHLGRIAGGRDLDDGELSLKVTGDGMTASGTGTVSGIAAKLNVAMDFRAGPPSQVLQHVTATGIATPAGLSGAGLPDGVAHLLTDGSAALAIDYAGRRDGAATLQADADLAQAAVKTPVGWSKPAGAPAAIGGRVTLDHGRLTGVENLHAEGPGLAIVSRARIKDGARTLLLDRLQIGRTSAHGEIEFPASARAPVRLALSGALLDLSPRLDAPKAGRAAHPAPEPPPDDEKPGQSWEATLNFAQVQLSRGKVLSPFSVDAADDGLRILHAQLHAGAQGEFSASIVPKLGGRTVSLSASDAGVALRALGVADNLAGGRLALDGAYDDSQAGSPLSGTATLTEFNVRDAPTIGRLLQAMTLYGLADLSRGPGLHFSKLVAPFRWCRRVLTLSSARAFSASLGITAKGDLDLRRHTANVTGTVVPAYFFNQLLGDLPVVGKIFSPEKGGGVFAARYSIRGALDQPKVGVNPLSALTPGFLREGFGLLAPKGAGVP